MHTACFCSSGGGGISGSYVPSRGVGLPSHPEYMNPEIPYPLPYRKEHETRDTLTPPSVDRHTCENITFLQLRWRAVMNSRWRRAFFACFYFL